MREIESTIKPTPIEYDKFGPQPLGEKFFSSVNNTPGKSIYGKTYMPAGFSEKFQDFFLDVIFVDALDTLTPIQRKIASRYFTEATSMTSLAIQEQFSANTIKTAIDDAKRKMWSELPEPLRDKYTLPEILKPRKYSRRKLEERFQPIGVAALPDSEIQARQEEKRRQEELREQRILKLKDGAYDMTPEERARDPKHGAIYNYHFVEDDEGGIPKQVRGFFAENPKLQVGSWKGIHARLWNGSYITYSGGRLIYVDNNGQRIDLNPFNIIHYLDPVNFDSDPDVIKRFAKLTFGQIYDDIMHVARLAGFNLSKTNS